MCVCVCVCYEVLVSSKSSINWANGAFFLLCFKHESWTVAAKGPIRGKENHTILSLSQYQGTSMGTLQTGTAKRWIGILLMVLICHGLKIGAQIEAVCGNMNLLFTSQSPQIIPALTNSVRTYLGCSEIRNTANPAVSVLVEQTVFKWRFLQGKQWSSAVRPQTETRSHVYGRSNPDPEQIFSRARLKLIREPPWMKMVGRNT